MAAKLLLLCLCFMTCILLVYNNLLCESGFCTEHLKNAKNKCRVTAPDCGINNATYSGLRLPSPTVCNCCDYCLPLYGRDKPCSVGGPGDGSTIGRCGHGLTCSNGTKTCVRMKTKCHDAQDEYDARFERGEVGSFETRPLCDVKGKFASYHCIPSQTCFCQSEEGQRLFGEVLYTSPYQNMHCGCSRFHEKIKKIITKTVPFPVQGPKCTSDGNFNPVQCIGMKCYCVDKITGIRDGSEMIDLNEKSIRELSCYKKEFDLFPEVFEGEPPYNLTMTPCFKNIEDKKKIITDGEKQGFIMDYFNTFDGMSCLPDGTNGRIGTLSNGSKICINEHSKRLGNYIANPDTTEFKTMDCKCALTSSLMDLSETKPTCCRNGNFRKIQCHRGVCRCVDSDGRQEGKENKDVQQLPCYQDVGSNWQHC